MRILFLDDMEDRHSAFTQANIGHHIDRVWSAREAIEALAVNEQYDIASLDHDLDPGSYEGAPKEMTGYDVARAMVSDELKAKLPKLTIVHSLNVPGGCMMLDVLQDAGARAVRIPFAWIRTYSEDWIK